MKEKSESEVAQSCPTLSDPMDAAHQAPPSMGSSRQESWSGGHRLLHLWGSSRQESWSGGHRLLHLWGSSGQEDWSGGHRLLQLWLLGYSKRCFNSALGSGLQK